jgi:hypothetical protein
MRSIWSGVTLKSQEPKWKSECKFHRRRSLLKWKFKRNTWAKGWTSMTFLETVCMEQSSFLEASSRWASQILRLLSHLKIHYRVHKVNLSWASSVKFTPSHRVSLMSVLVFSSHLRQSLFAWGFPTKIWYLSVPRIIQGLTISSFFIWFP